jgi:hypothetical protein
MHLCGHMWPAVCAAAPRCCHRSCARTMPACRAPLLHETGLCYSLQTWRPAAAAQHSLWCTPATVLRPGPGPAAGPHMPAVWPGWVCCRGRGGAWLASMTDSALSMMTASWSSASTDMASVARGEQGLRVGCMSAICTCAAITQAGCIWIHAKQAQGTAKPTVLQQQNSQGQLGCGHAPHPPAG